MRWMLLASTAALLAGLSSTGVSKVLDVPARSRALERIKAHVTSGSVAQGRADAEAAAKDGEFGVIDTADHENDQAANGGGTVCFTPFNTAPLVLTQYGSGDYETPATTIKLRYIISYNRTLVDQPAYPYRDICRARTKSEIDLQPGDPIRLTIPARTIAERPHDLFEAARRGTAADVRRLVSRKSVNAVDTVGMTALGWAVARDNRQAFRQLLSAGADPWAEGIYSYNAVYWAAALGRLTMFDRLARAPRRPFRSWPANYLSAAMSSNNRAILRAMFTQRHDKLRIDFLRRPLPDAGMFEIALDKQPDLATPILFKAMRGYSGVRPDLVRLALAHGANPNAIDDYETPLGLAARGIEPQSLEILEMLLKAGADPNQNSRGSRPVWEAFRSIESDESGQHWKPTGLPRAKYVRLIAAGASLNTLNAEGLPPIWSLLFPYGFDRSKLEPHSVTPGLLANLVSDGLNVNAEWKGKRVLQSVEAKAGPDSELAQTLRRLGAKP